MSKPAPPPQPVALNRNLSEIVSGRRVGDPKGGGMMRVESAKPKSEQVEANAGSIIVIGALIGLAMLIVLLVLTAG
jgi:hypothetical protein